jgi:hypothetical protein
MTGFLVWVEHISSIYNVGKFADLFSIHCSPNTDDGLAEYTFSEHLLSLVITHDHTLKATNNIIHY